MLDWVVTAHGEAGCSPIVVATTAERVGDVPEECIIAFDSMGMEGPRAGLLAGLRAAREYGENWAWLSPVDVPALDSGLLPVLMDAVKEGCAVMPISDAGAEPLLGVVPIEEALSILERPGGWQGSVRDLYDDLVAIEVGEEVWRARGVHEACFWNANRRADLSRIEKWVTESR